MRTSKIYLQLNNGDLIKIEKLAMSKVGKIEYCGEVKISNKADIKIAKVYVLRKE